ncbi:MAG: helix-turn-helix transcriptional regulator [[Clostridium] innocuum]|nr:helix-turn-helix transcriptional regulator [[Clostridium] innocuum]
MNSGLTQEQVAEDIKVTRQTISNWENERSYPDIMNVIDLSNLYSLSLDDLLKGDDKMIEHLEENTNIVKSNRKLIAAIMINVLLVILLVAFNMFLRDNQYYLIGVFCFAIISSAALLYQIIKKL